MFQRILVPLDGSARAEHAIPLAARLARASGGTLVFVRVVLPPHEIGTYSAEWGQIAMVKPSAFEKRLVEAEHYLTKVTLAYANDLRGINVKLDAETGAAAPTIFSVVRLEAIDLIVCCVATEKRAWRACSWAALRRRPCARARYLCSF